MAWRRLAGVAVRAWRILQFCSRAVETIDRKLFKSLKTIRALRRIKAGPSPALWQRADRSRRRTIRPFRPSSPSRDRRGMMDGPESPDRGQRDNDAKHDA